MKVLIDENMSPRIARALAALFDGEHEIVALRDRFGPGIKDVVWMSQLSHEGGWIVISGDRRITRNKAEAMTFRNSTLVGFFLARGLYKAKATKQMERLLVLWDRIEQQTSLVAGGAMFELQIKSPRLRQLKV